MRSSTDSLGFAAAAYGASKAVCGQRHATLWSLSWSLNSSASSAVRSGKNHQR